MAQAVPPDSRVTRRWGENATADFKQVTRDCLLTDGGNENSELLGIRDSQDKHSLLYFDLSAIPTGTTVHSAKLRIFWEVVYGAADQGKSGYPMDLYRICDPDGRGMWTENEATVDQRGDGTAWSASGNVFSCLSAEPLDRVFSDPFTFGQGAEELWLEWDVTPAIVGWVEGRYANQGFLLDGRRTLGLDAVARSREHPVAATRPYLEITYAGTGTYPPQVSGVQAQHHDGQTFITWDEGTDADPETTYRIYRHDAPFSSTPLVAVQCLDEVLHGSATFPRLEENDHRLTTPFSGGPLAEGTGLYVHTVESSGSCYYAVTRAVRGNENRTLGPESQSGPLAETVGPVSPVLQFSEDPDLDASANRHIYAVWLGQFDPIGSQDSHGYANRRSVAFLFRVTTPEVWDPASQYPLLVLFHYFGDSYFGGGHSVPEPGRFVVAPDDHDPLIKANFVGATMWYGYNSCYGTKRPPTEGIVVNYTERRVDWILDWVLHRSARFRIDPNRVYMKGGSMGGAAQWHYGIRRADLFAAGESSVPAINLSFDPEGRHFSLWGRESSLPTSDGVPLERRIDSGAHALAHPETDFPIMLMFARKGDEAILWPQMPPFFRAMDDSRHLGGLLYWVQGDHVDGEHPATLFGEWASQETYDDWIYQFARNQSYPAFSHFNLNDDPGNGAPTHGDDRGGFNRFARWDPTSLVDTALRWELTARLLPAAPAPTATADITPRRLQALDHAPATAYTWENRQLPSNQLAASGALFADTNGLITLTNVLLSKTGNRITIAKTRPAVVAIYPLAHGPAGSRFWVLLNTGEAHVQNLSLQISFDPAAQVTILRQGALANTMLMVADTSQAGTIAASFSGTSPVRGTGIVLDFELSPPLTTLPQILEMVLNLGQWPARIDTDTAAFRVDSDGDQASDLDEIRAGTDPANSLSVFRIAAITPAPDGSTTLTWSAIAGRSYQLEDSDSLLHPIWVNTGPTIIATGDRASFTDSTPVGLASRLYRVSTPE